MTTPEEQLSFDSEVVDFSDVGEWPCIQSSLLVPFIGQKVRVTIKPVEVPSKAESERSDGGVLSVKVAEWTEEDRVDVWESLKAQSSVAEGFHRQKFSLNAAVFQYDLLVSALKAIGDGHPDSSDIANWVLGEVGR